MYDHSDHNHSGHENHQNNTGEHGSDINNRSARDFLRRFLIVTVLLVPLALTNKAVAGILSFPAFNLDKWIQFGIATIIFGFSLVFFQHAWHEIKMRKYGMMTLVSLAVGAGYLFSAASTFYPFLNAEFYLEIATLIWVLLFGHYLEARSSLAAGDALAEVAKLLPKRAHRLSGNNEEDVDIGSLRENDLVSVKSGERIPADGTVIEGQSNIDESLISGESKPVEKQRGSSVVAGSIVMDGFLTVRIIRVGERSTIGQIQKLIASAQQTKPNSQRIADKASALLTFIVVSVAVLAFIIWFFIVGESFVFSITLAITVLVIACPHALGLAIPTVTTIATSLSAKNGVFIKDLSKFEVIKKADYVVFDKTGTLTRGQFGITDILAFDNFNQDEILQVASSIDRHSSHVIAQSVVKYAAAKGTDFAEASEFESIIGKGSRAKISGRNYFIGNKSLLAEFGIDINKAQKEAEKLSEKGKTIIFVADDKKTIGLIVLADEIKKESYEAVKKLHSLGIKVAMITGDNELAAKEVAEELKIDDYFSEVLPEDKFRHIKELQEKNNIVLMVGDGVNDAPALMQSDVGIAIGAGTDVAVEAGDVILTRNNPEDIARLLILSRKVYGKMVQNLVWAFGYNIITIPSAAGIFAGIGFILRPEIGALLMSASTVIVVINAMMLRRINLNA